MTGVATTAEGLSPHLRGSQGEPFAGHHRAGPIPAPVGEPLTDLQRRFVEAAYPRTCGGARRSFRAIA